MTFGQSLTVETLREMFRHLQAWHSLYEAEGIDVLTGPDGEEWSLWDIDILYEMSQHYLSVRQRQAIRLCLYENLSEARAARAMGTDESNPVTMYASSGLETLVHLYRVGMLPSVQQFRRERAKVNLRSKVMAPPWSYDWADTLADIIEETYVKPRPASSRSTSGSKNEPQGPSLVKTVISVTPAPSEEGAFYYEAEEWADYLDHRYSNGKGNYASPPT
jgi:hypothetical protein